MGGVAARARAQLSEGDIGCWVIKTAIAPESIVAGWAPGARRQVSRCLRPSYRLGLMAPGQRALLWLSGSDQPGVHAIGIFAGTVADGTPDPAALPETLGASPTVEVSLWLLPSPVPREELLSVPAMATAEVLRMPAGSNPSYLSPAQFDALLGHLDDADAETLREAGWR